MTKRQKEYIRAGYVERHDALVHALDEFRTYVEANIPTSKVPSCIDQASKAIFTADAYARNALGILLDEKKDEK